MQKVFINDRPLVFIHHTDTIPASKPYSQLVYESLESLKEAQNMLTDAVVDGVYLLCEEPNKCWDLFAQPYKYIAAAGGLVLNSDNKILMIYRLGKWDLPKGKAERGETMEQTALREVEEECGISDLRIVHGLPSTFHIYEAKGKQMLKESFWYTMKYAGNNTPTPQTEEGIEQIEWMSKEEVKTILPAAYGAIAELVNEYYLPTI